MAQTAKTPTKRRPSKAAADKPADSKPDQSQEYSVTIHGKNGDDIVAMQNRRVGESESFFNENKKYKLKKTRLENEKLYYGRNVSDDDEGEDDNLALDNRIFSSVRTVVPYTTSRITEPEVYPSSTSEAAKRFAEDFERALHIKADKEKARGKLKFALEDAIIRRGGYLKPRYDAATGNFFCLEYVPAESVVVDHKSKSYEEPRYVRFYLEKTPEDLIVMFPEMKTRILSLFNITDENDAAAMQKSQTINEDWVFINDEEGHLDLVVCWNYKERALGCIKDPNWRYGKENFLDNHLIPLIFVNVLSDGRTHIDQTSYVEQAKYSQKTINQRGKQIGENASLGSIGMPVVDSAALADDQSQYLTYEADTVLELDVNNAGKQSINDVFTTWKAGSLPADVYNDKTDAVEAVQNTFGASSIFQGQQSDNKTLGQDELLRDQSAGRQQELLDAVDDATERMYLLMAQFLLVYGDEEELFKLVGENNQFDYIIIKSSELDTNAEIRVKTGSSMPVDNPQRRATADKASQQGMIDPLTYWEIMDEPNADKYAKRVIDYKTNPAAFLADTEEDLFNRDAFVDIEIIKQGGTPPFRDDLPKEYFDYLNKYVVSGNLENPKIPLETRQALSQFIDEQLARAQKMLGMAESQLPTPQDAANFNQQADAANAAPQPQVPDMGGDPGQSAASALAQNQSPEPAAPAPNV